MDESDRAEGFKVTDRRRFATEETTKEEAREQAPKTTDKEAAQAELKDEAATGPGQEAPHEEELRPVTFTHLVVSLANTAIFQLGLVGGAEGEVKRDLPGARQTIDLIAMLQEKTRGNLTDQEERIVKDTLFQLRMAFVEAAK
jgi:hypothetical protein